MSVDFATPADTLPAADELDPAIAAAVEDCLAVADAWRAGELPLAAALALITAEPRAIGHAFNTAWSDPRRPALEALHAIDYAQREDEWGQRKVYTTFGWLSETTFAMVDRHMHSPDFDHLRYRRKAA
jgi:hypothetical protein